jgi:hypothetical protein
MSTEIDPSQLRCNACWKVIDASKSYRTYVNMYFEHFASSFGCHWKLPCEFLLADVIPCLQPVQPLILSSVCRKVLLQVDGVPSMRCKQTMHELVLLLPLVALPVETHSRIHESILLTQREVDGEFGVVELSHEINSDIMTLFFSFAAVHPGEANNLTLEASRYGDLQHVQLHIMQGWFVFLRNIPKLLLICQQFAYSFSIISSN